MNDKQFKMNVNNLWSISDLRIVMGNRIYANTINTLIKDSSLFPKICELRRDKKADRKKTAKLIKQAYEELGFTEAQINKEFEAYKKECPEYMALIEIEKKGEKMLKTKLEEMPLYTGFLSQIKGMGVKTSAKLLALVGDMTRFPKPSHLSSYAGLNPEDAGTRKKGVELTYNPKLKALLLGVIGDNFIKQNSQYRKVYDERTAKTKKVHPEWWHMDADGNKLKTKNNNPKHGYLDGKRVMIRRFVNELWNAGYLAQGIEPPCKPYILNFPQHNEEPSIVVYVNDNCLNENQAQSVET